MYIVTMMVSIVLRILFAVASLAMHRTNAANPRVYGYYVVDARTPGMYGIFCGSNSNMTTKKYIVICFHMGNNPVESWTYRSRLTTTRFMVLPKLRTDQTHILWNTRRASPKGGEVYVELSMKSALTILEDSAALSQEQNTDDTGPASQGTTIKSDVPSFLQMEFSTDVLTTLANSVNSHSWDTCINVAASMCRVNTSYKIHMQRLFVDGHTSLLGNAPVPNSTTSRIEVIEDQDLFPDFGLPDQVSMMAVARSYIESKMVVYHRNTLVRIEQLIWERECILVNELKELFVDYATYYNDTHRKIQMLVVMIMDGFYHLAVKAIERLEIMHNLILNVPFPNKWEYICKWDGIVTRFKQDLSEKLEVMVDAQTLAKLKQVIESYQYDYTLTILPESNEQVFNTRKSMFTIIKQELDALLRTELDMVSSEGGIRSTVAWFNAKEAFYSP